MARRRDGWTHDSTATSNAMDSCALPQACRHRTPGFRLQRARAVGSPPAEMDSCRIFHRNEERYISRTFLSEPHLTSYAHRPLHSWLRSGLSQHDVACTCLRSSAAGIASKITYLLRIQPCMSAATYLIRTPTSTAVLVPCLFQYVCTTHAPRFARPPAFAADPGG